ncbi:MAG: methylated-DNA--[protein]-cysteine S-methyltransferase [Candidatus Kryptoniota bacterium]
MITEAKLDIAIPRRRGSGHHHAMLAITHEMSNKVRDSALDMKVYCASFESPVGVIYVASTDRGVCKIALPRHGRTTFFEWIGKHFSEDAIVEDKKKNSEVIKQLNEYFVGKRTKFDLSLDLIGTRFQIRVWNEVYRTPFGTVVSYKQIAKRLHTQGYRLIGATIGRNPVPIIIPCHRVIGSNNKLVGYVGGIRLKEYLLRLEGVILL